jgi:3-phenylpropionate/trans-cinnamate dioxygenase ferredoxin subunit
VLEICPLAALPRGDARRVEGDPPIAVFHTDDGEVFAIDDTCTHQDASLADGWLEGCEIECPLHQGKFDVRTGQPTCAPATAPSADLATVSSKTAAARASTSTWTISRSAWSTASGPWSAPSSAWNCAC